VKSYDIVLEDSHHSRLTLSAKAAPPLPPVSEPHCRANQMSPAAATLDPLLGFHASSPMHVTPGSMALQFLNTSHYNSSQP
jgi:hypothetical protein